MPRFIVTEFHPIWVKEFYEVEAADWEECEESYYNGDYQYLGHNLYDSIEGRDCYGYHAEQADDGSVPFVLFPSRELDERSQATSEELAMARSLYGSDDIQFDDDAHVSKVEDGVWVAAWVWISADSFQEEEDN